MVCEDRLARFGMDLLRRLFASYSTEPEVLDSVELAAPEQELAKDLVSVITSFSVRLYGLRSHRTKALLRETRKVLKDDPVNSPLICEDRRYSATPLIH